MLEGTINGASRHAYPVRLSAASDTQPGVHITAFDITLDGERYGQRFDMIVNMVDRQGQMKDQQ